MEDNLEKANARIKHLEDQLLKEARLSVITAQGRELDLQEIIELRRENHELRAQLSEIQDKTS